jgi:hypothetical protein
LEMGRIENENTFQFSDGAEGGRGQASAECGVRSAERGTLILDVGLVVDGDADAFAAEHEPEDTEFPILEGVDVWVRGGIEILEGPGGDEVFAATFAAGKEEWDIGDLLGKNIDGAVDPHHLFVRIAEEWGGGMRLLAAEPRECGGGEVGDGDFDGSRRGGTAGDVEAKEVHGGGAAE